jgi:hypothetical protein
MKNTYCIMSFLVFLLFLLFTNCKSNNILSKSKDTFYRIKKIDSTLYPKIRMSNNEKNEMFKYYIILAQNKNNFFTIISPENSVKNCKEIKIGNFYRMKIDSTEDFLTKYHLNNEIKLGFDDVIKNKIGNVKNLYNTQNLKGLCYKY